MEWRVRTAGNTTINIQLYDILRVIVERRVRTACNTTIHIQLYDIISVVVERRVRTARWNTTINSQLCYCVDLTLRKIAI